MNNINTLRRARQLRQSLYSCALAVVLAIAFPAVSADDVLEQDIMIITASRVSESVTETLATADVLTRDDIERSAASDLLELLHVLPGVDIARTGGPGSQTSLFLRGSNSNHVLVLIDGTRMSSVNTGAFAWENLPVSQIQRIELVRGPAASFYGSDAIGGVIQIFTRRPDGYHARVRAGSYSDHEYEVGGRWQSETQAFDSWLTAEYRDVDGFSSQNPNGFSFNPDDDGHQVWSLTGGLETTLASHRLSASFYVSDNETEFDEGVSETDQDQFTVSLFGQLGSDWQHRLNLGYSSEDRKTTAFFSASESDRIDLDWQLDYQPTSEVSYTFGLAFVDEQGKSLDTFGNTPVYSGDRQNAAVFAGYARQLGQHSLQLSLRVDDNSEFDTESTGRVAYGFQIDEHWRLAASYGEAFRAPNLSEQLSPGFGGLFAGNPDLQPEQSDSTELSLSFVQQRHRGSISAYHTDVENLISFAGDDFMAINIARADLRGVELAYRYVHPRLQLQSSVTLQDAENADSNSALLRRPDQKLSFSADYSFDAGSSVGVEYFYSDEAEDFGATLDSYSLLALRGRMPLTDRVQLEARLDNILDEDYQLASGFNTPGRSGYLALRWQF